MYIDKAKLLEWLKRYSDNNQSTGWYDEYHQGIQKAINELEMEVEEGTFEANDSDFICPHCEKINSASSWNAATRGVFGEDIGEIQDAAGDVFICPACKTESELQEISKA